MKSYIDHSNEATEQYFPLEYKVVLSFQPVDKILKCDRSNKAHERTFTGCRVFFFKLYKTK